MSDVPWSEIVRSAMFRRALAQLGLVWLFLVLGSFLLLDRLSQQVRGGWALRSSVVEWVDDSEGEICFRQGAEGLEVLSGGAAHSMTSDEWLAGEGAASELDPFDSENEGLDIGELEITDPAIESLEPSVDVEEFDTEGFEAEPARGSDDEWLCVSREALIDDGTEALVSQAFELTPPDRLFQPLWIGGVLWLLVGGGLVFAGAIALARGPTALVIDLERARRRIEAGEHASRLRRRASHDLDAATTGINAILDRLESTITVLSEVSDNIAHDLRTPLTRLQGQLNLVRRTPSPTPEMIDSMQDEAGQLLETFNALLRIAHVKGGSRRKGFRTFDLVTVARDAGDLYGPAIEEQTLTFSALLPEHPVLVHGDADLWLQALSNLLDNALKYTPENGHVELEVQPGSTQAGTAAQLRVSDSGHGIPEGEMDKVLERFYRLSSHRRERGSGLGLSLVAAICELHWARIQLLNRDGLTVLIDLPRATHEAADSRPA
ncbi:MAG: HAMP domain-containing sensor histidine kinase [Acidobacteriota bacterium]